MTDGGVGTSVGSGSGGAATGDAGGAATADGGTGTGAGAGSGGTATGESPGAETWPAESDVRLGVTYGPTGTEYTGTMTGGSVDVNAIAAAVLAAMQASPPPVNTVQINSKPLAGSGTPADPMRPA